MEIDIKKLNNSNYLYYIIGFFIFNYYNYINFTYSYNFWLFYGIELHLFFNQLIFEYKLFFKDMIDEPVSYDPQLLSFKYNNYKYFVNDHVSFVEFFFIFLYSLYSLNLISSLSNIKFPITNFLGFCLPENTTLYNIILLYTEILFIGIIILLIILETISTILLNFQTINENFLIEVYKIESYSMFFFYKNTTVYNNFDFFLENSSRINYQPFNFYSSSEEFFDFFFTLFPTIIILMILFPALGYLYTEEFFLDNLMYDINLNVIGSQWYWTYEIKVQYLFNFEIFTLQNISVDYLEITSILNNSYNSKRLWEVELTVVLPAYVNILVSVTSTDVIHSWALPAYGIKVDAIPGRVATVSLESNVCGYTWGQCSELCGANHGFMPISINFVSPRFFWDWILFQDNDLFID